MGTMMKKHTLIILALSVTLCQTFPAIARVSYLTVKNEFYDHVVLPCTVKRTGGDVELAELLQSHELAKESTADWTNAIYEVMQHTESESDRRAAYVVWYNQCISKIDR